jgi:hypothetical protein
MILLFIGAIMGLSALLLVIYPLFGIDRSVPGPLRLGASRGGDAFIGDISERESAARQALVDVDFDYRLGNLDDEDYSQLRDRYEESALVALKARYERENALDEVIGRQLAALKAEEGRKVEAASPREVRRAVTATVRPATRTAPGRTGATGAGENRRRRRKGVS